MNHPTATLDRQAGRLDQMVHAQRRRVKKAKKVRENCIRNVNTQSPT